MGECSHAFDSPAEASRTLYVQYCTEGEKIFRGTIGCNIEQRIGNSLVVRDFILWISPFGSAKKLGIQWKRTLPNFEEFGERCNLNYREDLRAAVVNGWIFGSGR